MNYDDEAELHHAIQKCRYWIGRAEKAETDNASLRRALKPFAEAADEVLSCGCGGDGHAVRMDPEHWRAARNAASSPPPTGESGR